MTTRRAPREFELPFLPRFHPGLRAGRKVKTCRSSRKGRKGDTFIVPGSDPLIRGRLTCDAYPIALGDVATKHYADEDCEHPGDFIAVWNSIHPSGFDPDKVQFLHEFEVINHPEKPIVAWNPGQGDLVGSDGKPMTDAQETKARAYLERDLIKKVSDTTSDAGLRVEYYEISPLPGCKQNRRIWVETSRPDPTSLQERVSWTCDCQRSKGTSRTPPGPCSHALAVRYFRQHEERLARSAPA